MFATRAIANSIEGEAMSHNVFADARSSKEKQRLWRAKNPEKVRAHNEKAKQYQRLCRAKNLEKVRAKQRLSMAKQSKESRRTRGGWQSTERIQKR